MSTLDVTNKQEATTQALAEFGADADQTFSPHTFVMWVNDNRPELLLSVGESFLVNFAKGYIQCPVEDVPQKKTARRFRL